MTHMPATRAEAKRLGLIRYNTGKPCSHGHFSDRRVSDGVCCECGRLKSARQQKENPEKVKAVQKRWRDKNKPSNQSRWKEFYAKNREVIIAKNLERKKANPEKYALYQRVRLYRQKGAQGDVCYKELQQKIKDKGECNYCGSPENLTIDHMIPISRGGTNDISNLQILCASCNGSKQAKTHDEYMEYLEVLNGTYTRE